MATTFTYRGRDGAGATVTGSIEADDRARAAAQLLSEGTTPVEISEDRPSVLQREIKVPGLGPRVRRRDLAVFSRQLATMVNSGLTLLRSLTILAEQTENVALAGIVSEVRREVEGGKSLSEALAEHPKVFDDLYVSMVRAGEVGGMLDAVLVRLADTIEQQVELNRKIRSALTYPVAVLGLVVAMVMAMLVFVVPMFEEMYADLGGTLPLPTRILLAVSGFVTSHILIVLALQAASVWGFRRWLSTPRGRRGWDAFVLRVPVFGGLIRRVAVSRFSRTLAALMKAGVPILEALDIVRQTVGNTVVAEAVTDVQRAVRGGESVASPLQDHPVFPTMVVQMMAVGEETGALDEMLEKIAEFYDQEVEATVSTLTSLLEPGLIVVLGGAVGGMIVALYLPMFNVVNLIQ